MLTWTLETLERAQAVVDSLVSVALIAAYTVVTLSHGDGNGLLLLLTGWLGRGTTAAGVAKIVDVRGKGDSTDG